MINVVDKSIIELQKAMEKKELTAKELVLAYLVRIADIDQSGPKINAVLEVNPEAIHLADALDVEREQKGPRSLLHGIPVLVKDNIDTADKMHTSAGSLALANSYAKEDAFIIKQLRQAGAILLGKTNMTEWANYMTAGMPSGYSSRGGQVLNPYGIYKFSPGGSSSGSGAAVASNLCTVAIGTETAGSIISPSSENSLVGIKPTVGLLSRTGIIPISHSQDTAGPMARTVEDAVILLGALTGRDQKDPITLTSEGKRYKDYRLFLTKNGLQNQRIGVPKGCFYKNVTQEENEKMSEMIAILRAEGADVIEDLEIPSANQLKTSDVMRYEFKVGINAYLATTSHQVPIKTLKELIQFNKQHASKMLKYGQTWLEASEATTGTLTEPNYLRERRSDLKNAKEEGIDRLMDTYQLDALLFPSHHGADISARAGYPSIIVPAGYLNNGRPFGITFTAKAYREPKLIAMAYSFEQKTSFRRSPKVVK